MRKIWTGLIILILLFSFTTTIFAGEESTDLKEEETEVLELTHTVEAGDTLYKLARNYNITAEKIIEINGLESTMIYLGQRLRIPEKADDSADTYVVQPGDSLYKLAQRFDTSVDSIRESNNLSGNILYVGQELTIPQSTVTVNGRVSIGGRGRDIISAGEPVVDLNHEGEDSFQQGELIVKYRPVISAQDREKHAETFQMEAAATMSAEDGQYVRYSFKEDRDMEELIKELESQEQVEWVEPNYIYYPTAAPSDPHYNRQWNLEKMNMEDAWDSERGDDSVIVAVLDTGVITTHPDLEDNLLNGADFVGGSNESPVSSYEMTDDDPSDETTLGEGGSHGTHVAGIIGAVTNNTRGVAGINWDVSILPVRVLKKSGGTSWDIIEGIYYSIDQGADVINMSLGGTGYSRLTEEAINKAVEKGVSVIAATGNDGQESVYYPAAYEEVISVGAVGQNSELSYYSNYGPEVDFVAPGGDYSRSIYSTWGYYDPGSDRYISSYGAMRGTSMATPHVSGLAGLLYAAGYQKPEEIREQLKETAVDLGPEGRDDRYGYGLVDARAALRNKEEPPERPVVFTGEAEDNNIKIKSKQVETENDGRFTLNEISPGRRQIFGWIDENNNGTIDEDDYFGRSDILNITGKDVEGVEFILERVNRSDKNFEVKESADN
ncbi:MAG: S8 family serine peptidase [Halanaerobiaceae bacterium]